MKIRLSLAMSPAVLLALSFAGVATEAAEPQDPFRPPAIKTTEVPVIPPFLIDRLRQYQNVRSAAFAGWSPDGKGILIQTRFGDTAQLHRVYEPMGRRQQVTYFKEPAKGKFIPENKQVFCSLS